MPFPLRLENAKKLLVESRLMPLKLPRAVKPSRFHLVAPNTELFRNHHRDFGGVSFNPCKGAETRFAPLRDPLGGCITTFYAATTFDGAAYETMFRDPPGKFSSYPRQKIQNRGVSVISPRRELKLVGLFTPELNALGIDQTEMFTPSETVYGFCRSIAEMAWNDNPDADGIAWTSVRDSSSIAMLVFGERVKPQDFTIHLIRMVDTDPTLLDELEQTVKRCGSFISR